MNINYDEYYDNIFMHRYIIIRLLLLDSSKHNRLFMAQGLPYGQTGNKKTSIKCENCFCATLLVLNIICKLITNENKLKLSILDSNYSNVLPI